MGRVIVTPEDVKRVTDKLPSWFEPNPGFEFSWDGSPAKVIGWGGWRRADNYGFLDIIGGEKEALYKLSFMPATLVTAYLYKGEWHMTDIERMLNDGGICES